MVDLKVDLHAHVTDHYDIVYNSWVPFIGNKKYLGFLNRPKNVAQSLLEKSFRSDYATLLGVVNFADQRADAIFSELRGAALKNNYALTQNDKMLAIGIGSTHVLVYWKGREYRTNKGDILVMGKTDDINSTDLEYIVRSARDTPNSLVLVPHAGQRIIGIKKKDIEKIRPYIDGIDSFELSKELGIPHYAASDSHKISDAFLSYMKIRNLSSINIDDLPRIVRRSIRNGKVECCAVPFTKAEKLRHVTSFSLAVGGLISHFLKRDK